MYDAAVSDDAAVDYMLKHAKKILDISHFFSFNFQISTSYLYSDRRPARALDQATMKQTDGIVLQCVCRIT